MEKRTIKATTSKAKKKVLKCESVKAYELEQVRIDENGGTWLSERFYAELVQALFVRVQEGLRHVNDASLKLGSLRYKVKGLRRPGLADWERERKEEGFAEEAHWMESETLKALRSLRGIESALRETLYGKTPAGRRMQRVEIRKARAADKLRIEAEIAAFRAELAAAAAAKKDTARATEA